MIQFAFIYKIMIRFKNAFICTGVFLLSSIMVGAQDTILNKYSKGRR